MIMFPDVQKKAQAELMAVVGPNRLPEYEDVQSLPYIRAIAKECLRWRSVVPLGIPHRVLEDDEYRGFHIPKGAIVLTNIWYVPYLYWLKCCIEPHLRMVGPTRVTRQCMTTLRRLCPSASSPRMAGLTGRTCVTPRQSLLVTDAGKPLV